jgi:bifunctional non-homologous end joining protein LigD
MLWRLRSFPNFCDPCLPSRRLHEIKHDGFRLLARRGATSVRLFTRNGHDWTARFPLIVEALNALKATTCLIDGEAVTCSEAGLRTSRAYAVGGGDVHLCAFDLLELDGQDLRLEPLTKRRQILARLVRKPRCGLVLNEQYEHDGPLVFEHACLLGCEGIVSKRKTSRYRSGRSHSWVKVQEFQQRQRSNERQKRIGASADGTDEKTTRQSHTDPGA